MTVFRKKKKNVKLKCSGINHGDFNREIGIKIHWVYREN